MKPANQVEMKLLEQAATEFSRHELQTEREDNDQYPFKPLFEKTIQKAFETDFFHLTVPENFGGIGLGLEPFCKLLDSISQADASLAAIIFTNALAQEILIQAGCEELLKKIINKGRDAQSLLMAFPSFSNPVETKPPVIASKTKHGYCLEGNLEFLTLGTYAQQAIIPGRCEGSDTISFFLIDLTRESVSKSPAVFSLGLHACPAVDISLNRISGQLVGIRNQGDACFEAAVDRLQVAAAAMSTGIMKGSLAEALAYSTQRLQGGRQIIKWSEVQMILANMVVMTRNADLAVRQAGRGVDEANNGWQLDSRAVAIQVQKNACRVATDGIQVLGGYGYMKDYGQEKRYRDAKQLQSLLGITPVKKLNCLFKLNGNAQ